jgi:hypothetical protein
VNVDDHDGDVVFCVALYGTRDQLVGRLLGLSIRCQHDVECIGGQSFEKTVCAEHESVTGFAGYSGVIDVDVWDYADRSREDVPVGVSQGVLFAELASANQICNDGMVMREMFESPGPEAVQA